MKLLLIEDDPMIGESLSDGLVNEGHAMVWVQDGRSASLAIASDHFDLILLDLGLPQRSGLEVLREYRGNHGDAPVLIISARDEVVDRVEGLDCGADDYLPKPFDFDELCARIRALARRSGRRDGMLSHQGLVLDPLSRSATFNAEPIELTTSQFEILVALLKSPGAVISRTQLEQRLYGVNDQVESNTLDVFIHQLRRKLGSHFVRNVRGVGYALSDETDL